MLDLEFEYGDSAAPRGHAFIYFIDSSTAAVMASYLVVLPFKLDMQRYIPPFLSGQFKQLSPNDMAQIVIPPSPEVIQSKEALFQNAAQRGDDVLYGGSLTDADPATAMGKLGDISQAYVALCNENGCVMGDDYTMVEEGDILSDFELGEGVSESEEERLNEITSLLGNLSYANESGDTIRVTECRQRIEKIGTSLPEKFQIDRLAQHCTERSPAAIKLAALYLERAYCIQREEYLKVRELESEIDSLNSNGSI